MRMPNAGDHSRMETVFKETGRASPRFVFTAALSQPVEIFLDDQEVKFR